MAKFANLEEFYDSLPEDQERATRRLVEFITREYPELELVLAWNQPMFKFDSRYLIGFMPTKKHINLLTISDDAINHLAKKLKSYKQGARSIALPFDWDIDQTLIAEVIDFQKSL